MAYENLKQEIQDNIKTNGEGAITGRILQDTLLKMVNATTQGYTLWSNEIQDENNLPAVPTDGGKYFLFADYVSGKRKYRYIYFSDPDVNAGEWRSGGSLFRVELGRNESSNIGSAPITMSHSAIEEMITSRNRTLFLKYTRSGSGATWEDFITATEPINQEAEDQETIEHIGNNGGSNVALSVGGQGAKYYYLTGLVQNGEGDFALYFGGQGDGYIFTYGPYLYEIRVW